MDKDPLYFGSKYVEFCGGWDDSRRLNHLNGPMVIVSSAGMCEAGRIRHHLRHVVSDPDNAIVIVSYQAEGTLGRPDLRRRRAGADLRRVVRPECRGLRARRILRPRRPRRPRLVVLTDWRAHRTGFPRARRARIDGRARAVAPTLRPDTRSNTRAAHNLLTSRLHPSSQVIDSFPLRIVRSFIQIRASGWLGAAQCSTDSTQSHSQESFHETALSRSLCAFLLPRRLCLCGRLWWNRWRRAERAGVADVHGPSRRGRRRSRTRWSPTRSWRRAAGKRRVLAGNPRDHGQIEQGTRRRWAQ